MKLQIVILIIIIIAIVLLIYNIYCNRSKKEEHMTTNIPAEINTLLNGSDNTTYYTDDVNNTNVTNDTNETNNDNNAVADSSSNDNITSVDNLPYPNDSITSISTDNNITNTNKHNLCSVPFTEEDVEEYIKNLVLNQQKYCSNDKCNDKETIKNYKQDFFNFRDKVWDDSRHNDTAYKVARLYLEGNTNLSSRLKNKKIKNIFDELTQAQTIVDKNCIKPDNFLNTQHNGYYTIQGNNNNNFLTRHTLLYNNTPPPTNTINDNNTYGYDPMQIEYSSVNNVEVTSNNNKKS